VDRYSFIVEDLHLLLLAGLPGALRVDLIEELSSGSSTVTVGQKVNGSRWNPRNWETRGRYP